MFFKIKTVFVVFLATLAFSPAAGAVSLSGHAHGEFFADRVTDSPEPDGKVYEGYSFHSHLGLELSLLRGFSVTAELGLEGEPSGHHHGEDDHDEEDMDMDGMDMGTVTMMPEEDDDHEEHGAPAFVVSHNLSVDRLALNWRYASGIAAHTLSAGKIIPVVALNPHVFPGIYGGRAVHDYEDEMKNKIGLAYGLALKAGGYGSHTLDVAAFAADTTVLGFDHETPRLRLRQRNGGLSNTGDLSSFALSLSGGDFFSLKDGFFADLIEGISYRFGFARQAKGSDDPEEKKDETRFSVSLRNARGITADLSVRTVSEYMILNNYRREDEMFDRWQSTSSVAFDWRDNWTLAGTYAFVSNTGEPDDSFTSFSLSRSFGAAKVGLGYLRQKVEGEKTARAGLFFSYAGDFSIGSAMGHEGHDHHHY